MNDLEPLLAFWRAQDELFERIEAAWWGAVVSDARYPAIQEPNYARVEAREPVPLREIEAELLPALERSRCARSHVVVFHPEEQTDLLAEASTRGERLTWDLVMVLGEAPQAPGGSAPADAVQEITAFDEAFWSVHRSSARLFDITDEVTLDELRTMERELLIPAGRRWFTLANHEREDGRPDALAALLVLEGVGYLDHVVTFPEARRRGHAEALVRRAASEAKAMGASRMYLLADPEGAAIRIYERVGFERVKHLASWLSPDPR